LLATDPAAAVKVAVVLPAATVREVGTVNAAALLDSATVAPPVFDSIIAHSETAPDARLAGAHVRALTTVGGDRLTVAVIVLPFSVAMMVAV
jgi:hypothetical protein